MGQKALSKIKHGDKVMSCLSKGQLFFVADIQKAAGLDDKAIRLVLASLLKNNYLQNNKGQWFIP
jgi:hypothetical protein